MLVRSPVIEPLCLVDPAVCLIDGVPDLTGVAVASGLRSAGRGAVAVDLVVVSPEIRQQAAVVGEEPREEPAVLAMGVVLRRLGSRNTAQPLLQACLRSRPAVP